MCPPTRDTRQPKQTCRPTHTRVVGANTHSKLSYPKRAEARWVCQRAGVKLKWAHGHTRSRRCADTLATTYWPVLSFAMARRRRCRRRRQQRAGGGGGIETVIIHWVFWIPCARPCVCVCASQCVNQRNTESGKIYIKHTHTLTSTQSCNQRDFVT